jgi:hypothetical protein
MVNLTVFLCDLQGFEVRPWIWTQKRRGFGTCTHALAECFSLQWLSNSAGVKYPSDE